MDAGVGEAVVAGAQQLDRPRLGEALLAFRHLTLEQLTQHLEQDSALVHQQTGNGSTLLHAAAGAWDGDRMNFLLQKGAAVDVAVPMALERGMEVVFCDNRPASVGGDGDLDALTLSAADLARERFSS